MRTDVKIGIAVGLFVIVIAVVYFVVTGNPAPDATSGEGDGYQATMDGGKKDGKTDHWNESYTVREPEVTRGRIPDEGTTAADGDDDTRITSRYGDDDGGGGLVDSGDDDSFIDREDPMAGDDGGGTITPRIGDADEGGGLVDSGDDDDGGGFLLDDDEETGYGPVTLTERDGDDDTTDMDTGGTGGTGATTGEAGTYTVKKGDNGFWVIAEDYYGNGKYWTLIRDANPNASSTSLRPGMELVMPPKPKTTASRKFGKLLKTADHGKVVETVTGKKYYVVKEGDRGFWDVAVAAYGNGNHWKKIQAANPEVDTHNLRAGMKLAVPKLDKKTTSGGTASAAAKDHGKIIKSVTGQKHYVVKKGDRGFWSVAQVAWGNGALWPAIQKANPTINPRTLRPGMKIKVPAKPKAADLPTVSGSAPSSPVRTTTGEESDARPDFSGRLD
jgi:nucleoid-associated protein YgaU